MSRPAAPGKPLAHPLRTATMHSFSSEIVT
jgi:hypothetical protein